MIGSFFIFYLPLIAAVSLILYCPVYLVGRHKYGKRPFARHLAQYALTGYALSLLYLTVLWYYPDLSFDQRWHFLNLHPFVWLSRAYEMGEGKMTEQLLLNIAMFVPLGFLLPVVLPRMRALWKTGLASLAVTVSIETLQYFLGRSADIDDVIMNLAGGITGYLLFLVLSRMLSGSALWRAALGGEGADGRKR